MVGGNKFIRVAMIITSLVIGNVINAILVRVAEGVDIDPVL